MTSSRRTGASLALAASLAVTGCSFSAGAQEGHPSSGSISTAPRTSAAGAPGPATSGPATSGPATSGPATPSAGPSDPGPSDPAASDRGAPSPVMSSPTTPAPRAAATAASPTPGSGAGQGASASGSDNADPGRCETRDLMVSVGGGSGGAAGSVDTAVVLTNTGTARCTLYGYPGVSYVAGPDGSQVGAAATRDPTTTPARVILAPGGVAHAELRIVDARAYPDAACRPAAVDGYRVYPPGTRSAAFVAQAATTCSAAAARVLSVQPVEPGPPPA